MYHAKHQTKRRHSRKPAILLASLILIMCLAAGVTVAYIFTGSSAVTNSFELADVSCEIKENFDGSTKSNVYVLNTSNVDAYIRAAIVVNWTDAEGNLVPAPDGCSYSLSAPDTGWTQSDGYYYYNGKVAPGGSTSVLIPYAAPGGSAEGYRLRVDVVADAIQAEPASAVTEAWGWIPPVVS